jgi:NDP-sugar pyrophosphorylase family protein
MILAAGLGTRLRPLTNDRPKALVEVAGRTLLEITLRRLSSFGIRDVIVNVHHFSDLVVDYLTKNNHFGMRIEISREDVLLDTGGGLKRAAWFFLESARSGQDDEEQPFVLHNVDVLSSIDLNRMLQFHRESGALATLAVQDRKTSRYLLFDDDRRLCGRRSGDDAPELVRVPERFHAWAFSGIHVISPRLLRMITEEGVFSIVSTYLRIASQGEKIRAFPAGEYYWRDLGKPENVSQAERDVQQKVISL